MSRGLSLSVVIVTYESAAEIGGTLEALVAQLEEGDEIIVVDNASRDATVAVVGACAPQARVVQTGRNAGFAAGANLGVDAATCPLVLLLNPDAEVLPGCIDELRSAGHTHPGWGAWQALVLLPNGRINSAGGRVHFLGFGWAGAWGAPRESAPTRPGPVGFASGAALCVRRDAWQAVGGFDASYFMYGEDLDLSLRLALCGWGVGIAPAAVISHDYTFERGGWKWFLLERNRWSTVLTTYPRALLIGLAPALIAFEVALLVVAARDGWLGPKRQAMRVAISRLPVTWRRRKAVQAASTVELGSWARLLTADLDGDYFAGLNARRALLAPVRAYWRLVLAVVGRRR